MGPSLIHIVSPFLAGFLLIGIGIGAAHLLRTRYDRTQIAEQRGGAGCLLTATFGSLLLALLAFGMGLYAAVVHWILGH